jgi:LysM repeat protein
MRTVTRKKTFLLGFALSLLTGWYALGQQTYLVQKGDTESSICRKFQISLDALSTANPGLKATRLGIGQPITIPGELLSGTITAAPGAVENSPKFKSALNYGVAQALYSSFDLNCWCAVCGPEMFQVTQNIHDKFGKPVKIDISGRKDVDGDSMRLSVFFPEFTIGNKKLFLTFVYDRTNYFFVDNGFGEEQSPCDFSETNGTVDLPLNFRSVIDSEFSPTVGQIAKITSCCQEMLKSNYPQQAAHTNHFFLAPYCEQNDRRPTSLYWVEGKKVIQIEHLSYPDGTEGFLPKEMSDFSGPIQAEKTADYASSYEWRNFQIFRHSVDGFLLTLEPAKP